MKLFNFSKSLDKEAQERLAATRKACAELMESMSDATKLELFAICSALASTPDLVGVAGALATLGYMEAVCTIARTQAQEAN